MAKQQPTMAELKRELAAYKKAKAENDERFMRERDEAREQRDTLLRDAEIVRVEWEGAAADWHGKYLAADALLRRWVRPSGEPLDVLMRDTREHYKKMPR